ncbi:hypothetical protein BH11BAC6_BH11BAC6_09500 [soil metagenome]
MQTTTLYCGIDVSSDTLDACYQTADNVLQNCKVSNDVKGYHQLLKQTGYLSFCYGGNRRLSYQAYILFA